MQINRNNLESQSSFPKICAMSSIFVSLILFPILEMDVLCAFAGGISMTGVIAWLHCRKRGEYSHRMLFLWATQSLVDIFATAFVVLWILTSSDMFYGIIILAVVLSCHFLFVLLSTAYLFRRTNHIDTMSAWSVVVSNVLALLSYVLDKT